MFGNMYSQYPFMPSQMGQNAPFMSAVEYATKGELAQLRGIVQQLIDGLSNTTSSQGKKEASAE